MAAINRRLTLLVCAAVLVLASIVGLATLGVLFPETASAQFPAAGCCTRFGRCPLMGPQLQGTPCYCASPYGPIGGFAC